MIDPQAVEVRRQSLKRLQQLAERLPNGLLHRLVEDAQFFYDWNLRKKGARSSSRMAQGQRLTEQLEERQWKRNMQEKGLGR